MSSELQTGNQPPKPEDFSRSLTVLCVLAVAGASALVFRGVWNPANTINGADASLWVPMFVRTWTETLYVPRWFPHYLAGIPQQFQFMSQALPLALLLPPHRFHGFEFMLDTFLAGAFMFAFLRSLRLDRFGALVGGLSFALGNGLLTGAAQGVLWKFDTACWVPLFLLFFTRILDDHPNRLRNCLFAGAALGLQFLGGEVQLAYYVCLLAVAYFAFDSTGRLLDAKKAGTVAGEVRISGRRFFLAAACAVIGIAFAAEVFCSYTTFLRRQENVGVTTEEDNWRFATEFSFPPGETIALALTGEALGDESLLRNHEGSRIRRITDDYIGIFVLFFAAIGLVSGNRRAYFFAGAAIVALFISYGRFFPAPYRLIYALPGMKGLRNPHKWLFITSVCIPVVAGIGADYWKNAPREKSARIIAAIVLFFGLMIVGTFLSPLVGGSSSRLTSVSPEVKVLLALLFMVSLACVAERTGIKKNEMLRALEKPLLVFILAFDLMFNASKFISYYNYNEKYVEDDLVQWVRSQEGPFRVKVWSENSYLRSVMTEVLPYHGVDVLDAIMSRRPGRYSDVFEAVRKETLSFDRLFQLFNVKYLLSAAPISSTEIKMEQVAAFDRETDRGAKSRSYVYRLNDFLERVYVVNRFEVTQPEGVVERLGRSDFDLTTSVVLEESPGITMDTAAGAPVWRLEGFSQSPHKVDLTLTVDRPSILVLQDFMDEDWHACVDGAKVSILHANYLMRAVAVPSGTHAIVFRYRPPVWGYAVTLAGWIIIALAVVYELVRPLISGKPQTTETGA